MNQAISENPPIAVADSDGAKGRAEMSAIARLENWHSAHKARWAKIEIDDGYGATCWRVDLHGEGKRTVHASECSFMEGDLPENAVTAETEDDCFPGLEATINAALDKWEGRK